MDLHIHTKTGSEGTLSVVEVSPKNHVIIDSSKALPTTIKRVLGK